MPRKRFGAEQIILKLREAEVGLSRFQAPRYSAAISIGIW